jgi:Bacterial TSP3 repeat
MRGWLGWLQLSVVVVACAASAAASAASPAEREQASVAATPSGDTDGDGLSDTAEAGRFHTSPRKRDTDGDRLNDGAEVKRYHTDPRKRDTDGDGLQDGDEVERYKTNPRLRDSDGDGWGDRAEITAGTNPRNARERPGFPREGTTGVPPGTALSKYSGPSTITRAHTVISGKMIGCIQVQAPGVVIRNSKISCNGLAVATFDGEYSGTPLLIEDTEIDCQNAPGSHGIGDANVTVRRVEITACENGLDINQNVIVEDSYIHNLYNGGDSHMDGLQLAGHWNGSSFVDGALNVTIRHNTIYGMGDGDTTFGTSAIFTIRPGNTNILIEDNLLAGGAFTIYCQQGSRGTNYRVLNNHFSRKYKATIGYYGSATDCSDETQSGNVIHETGKPLKLE